MSFLEIALRNASRGFRVMPIKGKNAFLPNWTDILENSFVLTSCPTVPTCLPSQTHWLTQPMFSL
jgi:hypothetical protein